MAYNDGYTQFWSQDRLSQWANLYQASSQHFAGGWGYLNVGGQGRRARCTSTGPRATNYTRTFGVGYYHRHVVADGIDVSDAVYAPFGNDPVLVHDVTLAQHDHAPAARRSWFEYWDVNPYDQSLAFQRNIGMNAPDLERGHEDAGRRADGHAGGRHEPAEHLRGRA